MNFINRLFRSNMIECPRCLGKGKVDESDIKRLKKELFWMPGKCAYCNGIGKVPPGRMEKLSADTEYLTTDLPSWERYKVINGDKEALKRADDYRERIEEIVAHIEHLYYIENMEPPEIADHLFHMQGSYTYTTTQRTELIEYVEKVLKSKRKG